MSVIIIAGDWKRNQKDLRGEKQHQLSVGFKQEKEHCMFPFRAPKQLHFVIGLSQRHNITELE